MNEDELFGEKKMKEAQMSISEKLKAIKAKQMADKASEDPDHVHDPEKFSFIKTTKLKNIHSGAYSYSG